MYQERLVIRGQNAGYHFSLKQLVGHPWQLCTHSYGSEILDVASAAFE